jgi:hypothetical protein
MGVYGAFGMIACIFDSFKPCRFELLIGFGQLLNALVIGIFGGRQPLQIARLSGTVGADFSGIIPQFIRLSFIAFGVALSFNVFAHECLRALGCRIESCRWEQELGCLQFFFEIGLYFPLSAGRQLGPSGGEVEDIDRHLTFGINERDLNVAMLVGEAGTDSMQ